MIETIASYSNWLWFGLLGLTALWLFFGGWRYYGCTTSIYEADERRQSRKSELDATTKSLLLECDAGLRPEVFLPEPWTYEPPIPIEPASGMASVTEVYVASEDGQDRVRLAKMMTRDDIEGN